MDVTSAMCLGSTNEGKLVNISEATVRQRCAADDICIGYCMHESNEYAIPLLSWQNRRKTLRGFRTHAKEDHCSIDDDAGALVEAMNRFMVDTWRALEQSTKEPVGYWSRIPINFPKNIHKYMREISTFAAGVLPPAVRALPVFYPFSGFDYLIARAFFPRASRFVLTSSLPLGDLRCFLVPQCVAALTDATYRVLNMWGYHHYAWTEEKVMDTVLKDQPAFNMSLGVAPLLLISLAASRETLSAIHRDPHTNHVTFTSSNGTRLSYLRLFLGMQPIEADLATFDAILHPRAPSGAAPHQQAVVAESRGSASTRPRFAVMIKAAALVWPFMSGAPWMRWLVDHAEAFVQDDTGIVPSALQPVSAPGYSRSTRDAPHTLRGHHRSERPWRVLGFGNYSSLVTSYVKQQIFVPWTVVTKGKDTNYTAAYAWRDELLSFYNTTEPLPFGFGYGDRRGAGEQASGCLLTAWRRDLEVSDA